MTTLEAVHHLHAWQLNEHDCILEAQVKVKNSPSQATLNAIKLGLEQQFDLTHTTIELSQTLSEPDNCVSVN